MGRAKKSVPFSFAQAGQTVGLRFPVLSHFQSIIFLRANAILVMFELSLPWGEDWHYSLDDNPAHGFEIVGVNFNMPGS